MRFPPSLAAALAAALLVAACGDSKSPAPAAPAAPAEPPAATVNGTPISQRAVEIAARETGAPADTPEARKALVDQLAIQVLAAEEAVKKGLDKSPEVAERINLVRQSILANAYVQELVKTASATDEAIKAEYDRLKGEVSGTEYKARHILVGSEAEARDVIARLKANPNAFAKLASERSKDPGSKARGGDLGWFDAKRMVPEFGNAVAKLDKGALTQAPVQTPFGWHVILLEDTRPIEPPPLDQVKPAIARQLQQQAVMKQLDALKASAKIEMAQAPAAPSQAPASSQPSASPPAAPAAQAPASLQAPAAPAPAPAAPSK